MVLELGPILAMPYLLIRMLICGTLFSTAARSARAGNALPMLLFGSCALLMVIGQFSQTSTLGFAVLGAGLCLAAANASGGLVGESESAEDMAGIEASQPRKSRGRSPYAATLHGDKPVGLD